jgi:hypothetical protein
MTDVAADIADMSQSVAHQSQDGLRLLCVGRLDAWRGFDLAIEAVAELREAGLPVHLDILGKGPDKPRLKKLITSLSLGDIVSLCGEVSSEDYRRYLSDADIVLNPSLKEGAVTVSFDTMAAGKPLVALDTTGYTRYFRPEYAAVIPRGKRDEVISSIAAAVSRLADDSLRQSMGQSAIEAASKFSWKFHGDEIREAVRSVISDK